MKNLKILNILFIHSLFLLPFIVKAQSIQEYLRDASNVFNNLIVVIIGLALVFFLWTLSKIILNAGNEQDKEKNKKNIVWGIIVLIIIVSVWGIVNFLSDFIAPANLM